MFRHNHRNYEDPIPLSLRQAEDLLNSDNQADAARACVSLAMYETDVERVVQVLRDVALDMRREVSLRALAITCFGHLVRRSPGVSLTAICETLQSLMAETALFGAIDDAMDDIKIFSAKSG